jgi:hypothetical protein
VMMANGGDAGQTMISAGTAGEQTAGGPNSDAGAAGSGNEAGTNNNGGSGGNSGSGGANGGGTGGAAEACIENTQRPCYTGNPDARGKGACTEGTQTCSSGAWGACSGDVKPVLEICDDGVDNDCDGLKDDCGDFRCSVTMTSQSIVDAATVAAVARDSAGSAIVTGAYKGDVDFGGGKKLTSVGNWDIFIAKYSSECELVWIDSFGSTKIDRGFAVAVAANDDIVVGGIGGEFAFTGDDGIDIDLGGGSLKHTGPGDAFLARYDSDGKHIWSHLYGGESPAQTTGIAIAPNGDIAISAMSSADFGGGEIGYGAIAARYTSDGDYVWQRLVSYGIVNGLNTQSTAVDVDSEGRVLITGTFDAKNSHDGAFLTSISADGQQLNFEKKITTSTVPPPASTFDRGNSIATRGTDIYWAGVVTPAIDLGGGDLTGGGDGNWDAMFASYNKEGAFRWGFLDGGTGSDNAQDIALDSQGNIGFVGYDYPFGIILKYSPTGRYLWAKGLDTPGGNSCAFGTDDSLAVAGYFQGTNDFGNGPQTPVGNQDGFLLIFEP